MAIVPGALVWLTFAACSIIWIAVLAVVSGALVGPKQLLRRLLESWLSRCVLLAFWAEAGWHIFCQRP